MPVRSWTARGYQAHPPTPSGRPPATLETILARRLKQPATPAPATKPTPSSGEALHASGDITIHGSTLHIRLDPLSAPRRTRALAALCEQLTTTTTRYPGTRLVLHYEVKEHPGTT